MLGRDRVTSTAGCHVIDTSWPLGQRGSRVASVPGRRCSPCRSPDKVELHPVQQRALGDRACMGRPLPQGLAVALPGPADVARRDSGKRHQLHGVDLDLRRADAIPPARPHPGPAPQPEGHGDVARQHRFPQIPSELHQPMLRLPPGAPAPPGRSPVPAFPAARPRFIHTCQASAWTGASSRPPQRLLERTNIWRLGTLTTATIDT
jgi:hypothetical protein